MWGHSCTNKSSKSADRAGLNFNSPRLIIATIIFQAVAFKTLRAVIFI